jgi:hypothetical protein
MTSQADLLDRAAECERSMEVATDPVRRHVLRRLRDVWINLANDDNDDMAMSPERLREETTELIKMQSDLVQ